MNVLRAKNKACVSLRMALQTRVSPLCLPIVFNELNGPVLMVMVGDQSDIGLVDLELEEVV